MGLRFERHKRVIIGIELEARRVTSFTAQLGLQHRALNGVAWDWWLLWHHWPLSASRIERRLQVVPFGSRFFVNLLGPLVVRPRNQALGFAQVDGVAAVVHSVAEKVHVKTVQLKGLALQWERLGRLLHCTLEDAQSGSQ